MLLLDKRKGVIKMEEQITEIGRDAFLSLTSQETEFLQRILVDRLSSKHKAHTKDIRELLEDQPDRFNDKKDLEIERVVLKKISFPDLM